MHNVEHYNYDNKKIVFKNTLKNLRFMVPSFFVKNSFGTPCGLHMFMHGDRPLHGYKLSSHE